MYISNWYIKQFEAVRYWRINDGPQYADGINHESYSRYIPGY